jgi:hypothetical protein
MQSTPSFDFSGHLLEVAHVAAEFLARPLTPALVGTVLPLIIPSSSIGSMKRARVSLLAATPSAIERALPGACVE